MNCMEQQFTFLHTVFLSFRHFSSTFWFVSCLTRWQKISIRLYKCYDSCVCVSVCVHFLRSNFSLSVPIKYALHLIFFFVKRKENSERFATYHEFLHRSAAPNWASFWNGSKEIVNVGMINIFSMHTNDVYRKVCFCICQTSVYLNTDQWYGKGKITPSHHLLQSRLKLLKHLGDHFFLKNFFWSILSAMFST